MHCISSADCYLLYNSLASLHISTLPNRTNDIHDLNSSRSPDSVDGQAIEMQAQGGEAGKDEESLPSNYNGINDVSSATVMQTQGEEGKDEKSMPPIYDKVDKFSSAVSKWIEGGEVKGVKEYTVEPL